MITITNNLNNNTDLLNETRTVDSPSVQSAAENFCSEITDEFINPDTSKILTKRNVHLSIGLPFKISCKLTLDISQPNAKCLYPHTFLVNEVYCLLTDLQLRFFFKHKKHLSCPFVEDSKQRLKIISPNAIRPFHVMNINGNKFNLVPKSKLGFLTQTVITKSTTQIQKVLSEHEIQQEKSRLRVKLWSLSLMPETLDIILAYFLKDSKLENLNLPDCAALEIEKIKELVQN